MAYIDTVKPWFETGDKPTQAQFWTLFSYLRFKDDAIKKEDIEGLISILAAKAEQASLDSFIGGELVLFNADGEYVIPSEYMLEKLIIVPVVNLVVNIGLTAGGDEVLNAFNVTTDGQVCVINLFALASKTIYFSGLSAGTKIIFIKRKIKLT